MLLGKPASEMNYEATVAVRTRDRDGDPSSSRPRGRRSKSRASCPSAGATTTNSIARRMGQKGHQKNMWDNLAPQFDAFPLKLTSCRRC